MAEIKSTLDLVMEKTKGFTLSDEEKDSIKREEALAKVPGHVDRLLTLATTPERLDEELRDLQPGLRKEVIRAVVAGLVGGLGDAEDRDRELGLIGELALEEDREWLARVKDWTDRFAKAESEMIAGERRRMLDDLAAAGISGSAVVVKPERGAAWLARREELLGELAVLQRDFNGVVA